MLLAKALDVGWSQKILKLREKNLVIILIAAREKRAVDSHWSYDLS